MFAASYLLHNLMRLLQTSVVLPETDAISGTMRSGDLHNCTQMDLILSGRAILRRLVSNIIVTLLALDMDGF